MKVQVGTNWFLSETHLSIITADFGLQPLQVIGPESGLGGEPFALGTGWVGFSRSIWALLGQDQDQTSLLCAGTIEAGAAEIPTARSRASATKQVQVFTAAAVHVQCSRGEKEG